ncbi:MAG: hypothetical protein A2538_00940 [Candidatus Magasanikbacteria bacterium RIFOXYD2_FULL_41_14]|uniref:histidine kinase n=1 Tax=Candidatus Magasanikbacteria bacterium RIFOXYD2_FULL_41_14 TaxID=1798709 RepID=A0A1F6PDW3_9BACT|nr:MAG: hypothetical protein A2538_00940 [Candidatus Magasanikbacteria bacterium RIFOXYD2_FULL_41_14]
MSYFLPNLDLISVGLVSAATAIMGFVIFFSNKRSRTNQFFLLFSLVTILWGAVNYFIYQVDSPVLALWLTRVVMFAATWQAFSIFQLFYVFPSDKVDLSKNYKYLLIPLVAFTSLLTVTPYFFGGITEYTVGQAPIVSKGPGLIMFGLLSVSLVLAGLFLLVKKTLRASEKSRLPFIFVLVGTFLTFLLIIIFNFVLPIFFENVTFIPFGAVFTFPFIIFTAYAIIRHNLLNVKILAAEFLVFAVLAVSLVEMIFSNSLVEKIIRSLMFLTLLFFSVLLVRSVRKEVDQRVILQKLTEELETANGKLKELDKQKTDFLSIAAHQLRTPMSIAKGYLELLEDGAYGNTSPEMLKVFTDMDTSNEHLIKLIDQFLDISRIEQGRTKYDFKMENVQDLVEGVVKELRARAHDKGLKLVWKKDADIKSDINIDAEKIRHVVFNFIDNAIKYSEHGDIKIDLKIQKRRLVVTVKDTGLGFGKEDEGRFFQKFYRGENVKGVNVGGTGIGLYVCRMFVEEHKGEVWAKSDGRGKGSEFGFSLPVATLAQSSDLKK